MDGSRPLMSVSQGMAAHRTRLIGRLDGELAQAACTAPPVLLLKHMTTMLLSQLLATLDDARYHLKAERQVAAVEEDSRQVGPDSVFVAVPGFTVDGHAFVAKAVAQGAAAVVVDQHRMPSGLPDSVTVVAVPDTRAALSRLAAAWHGIPARSLRVIGVTGTDGKTTTSTMLAWLLERSGFVSGMTGTAQIKVGPNWQPNATRQTTLEPLDVHAHLAAMRAAGVTHAVIEASSHGLALHKLDDCLFDAAVVTNLNEDHLDFHGTREHYWAAKARLFAMVGAATGDKGNGPAFAVLNRDDASHDFLRAHARVPVLTYGLERADVDLTVTVKEATAAGSHLHLRGRWGGHDAWLPLPGGFNAANAAAALTVLLAHDVNAATASAALADFPGVPGRMNVVDRGQPFSLVIDYAHTGTAFAKLLAVLRPLTAGRIVAVFGSAGEQSQGRRAGMATAAAAGADVSVLTSEDPRGEDADAIIADIAAVMAQAGRREGSDFHRRTDRREAIRLAVSLARPGDVVVLAGKGHEQSIIWGGRRLPWDERSVAEAELDRIR